MPAQEYKTRIQLKSDIEDNWKKVHNSFKPLAGEMIIYSPDNTYHYCRVKIGDGQQFLSQLDFIDAGTVNGHEVEVVKLASFDNRPSPGSPDKLYVDMETNTIYHYDGASGYTQLSHFSYTPSTTEVSVISQWRAGVLTQLSIDNNTLKITNGQLPTLSHYNTRVVSGITEQG